MGVSGCGKSTVGSLLAARLGREFADADDLHAPEARASMAAGTALTDEDRAPWLRRVGQRIAAAESNSEIVVACSALKRSYRDLIRQEAGAVFLVHLHGSYELLQSRVAARTGHFMPSELLTSQLATLEPLQADELGVTLSVDQGCDTLLDAAVEWVNRTGESG
ncbi:gluconokinase [Nesterenkonia natronophila]|uniref:Gluconokinase n=2 Tax=Nesterenkonia natronophila TaxID=2174932 RepID=A0A3A4F324_9MICC|nr:gluconokinase [Nesterenkonia natronophila]